MPHVHKEFVQEMFTPTNLSSPMVVEFHHNNKTAIMYLATILFGDITEFKIIVSFSKVMK